MSTRPEDLIYAVDEKPPFIKLIFLGLQHAILMGIYLVIISIVARQAGVSAVIANNAMRMGLIALAISTILQSLTKGPIGSGYLAAPVISAIYLEPSLLAAKMGGLPVVFGMTIFAGLIEILFSRFIYRLRVMFPPGICGFIISIVGLALGLIGVEQVLGVENFTSPNFHLHVATALVTLGVIVGLSVWWRGVMRLMCSFIGIIVGFILAFALGLVPASSIAILKNSAYFAIPDPSYISYHFSYALILPFFIAAIAASLRTIGVITTCQKINDANWKHPDLKTIRGGMLADGIGCFLAGILGSIGMNTAPSLVGISKATGATSRYIGYAAGIILIIIAFLPKITAFILILPLPVIGAVLVFTGSFMIVGGIQIMVSRNIDTRMTFVIGISLLLGVSRDLFPHYYNSLPNYIQPFTSTLMSLSITSAVLLNLLFRIGIKQKTEISFEKTEISYHQLEEFLHKRGSAWDVNDEVIERAISTTEQVMKHIYQTQLAQSPIETIISYDQVDFIVKIKYSGELLTMPFVGQQRKDFLEEEAFSYGLADFWTGVHPDKLEYSSKGKNVEIILYFSA